MREVAVVTGAFGFIGRHVARRLQRAGYRVVGIGHGAWTREEWSAWGLSDWRLADITLDSLVTYGSNPTAIIHCAGGASVAFSVEHPYEDFHRTVASTAAVLEYVRLHAKSARVVLASSAGVYGEGTAATIAESSESRPVSPYGAHKKMAEELCLAFGRAGGVATAIVRLFSVYGPGLRKQLLWEACERLAGGENRFFGSGREVRDWLHIDDAASLLVAAIEAARSDAPVFNGGTGNGTAIADVLAELFRALGRTDSPAFSNESRTGDPSSLVADISKARALGWSPIRQFRDGVGEYAAWYRSGAG